MTKHSADYSISFGLTGCYMPNSEPYPVSFDTRKALADFIRTTLVEYDLPACLFREVGITRLWHHIKRHGSSVAHFSLSHGDYTLGFHGLTSTEYADATRDDY